MFVSFFVCIHTHTRTAHCSSFYRCDLCLLADPSCAWCDDVVREISRNRLVSVGGGGGVGWLVCVWGEVGRCMWVGRDRLVCVGGGRLVCVREERYVGVCVGGGRLVCVGGGRLVCV